jgi:hypothetical protein
MAATREQIQAALFALTDSLQDTPFVTRKRIINVEAAVADVQQPALYQVWIGEDVTQQTGTPPVFKAQIWWVLYANRGDYQDALASEVMAPLIDACDQALTPAPGLDAVTLGGIVSYARREGRVEVSEAPLGQQVVAVYPISILWPQGLTC